ncbi:hypothetical protein, partial [Tistrella bauzanensis]|uniref:hypothetical protein n=1 Tax=Tistrella bauzanensis TaxID=657419 RepID=UPI001E51F0B3
MMGSHLSSTMYGRERRQVGYRGMMQHHAPPGSRLLPEASGRGKPPPVPAQGYRICPMIDLANSSDHPARFRLRLIG